MGCLLWGYSLTGLPRESIQRHVPSQCRQTNSKCMLLLFGEHHPRMAHCFPNLSHNAIITKHWCILFDLLFSTLPIKPSLFPKQHDIPETIREARDFKVIPLYKKEHQRVFENYRPISLLSSISQIFEKVAFKQISEYCTYNNLLFNSQYGFRKNHSTELAALEFVDRIKLEMDRKKIPFLIFLDLSKAFDTLNPDISSTKLRYNGIGGVALNWVQRYLTKRTQCVQYNDTSSSIREIETGVPQGSILGPLLFIIYMNDNHTVSQQFTFILYADDTTLFSPLCSFIHISQSDMD